MISYTPSEIQEEIGKRFEQGEPTISLAKRFNKSYATTSSIILRYQRKKEKERVKERYFDVESHEDWLCGEAKC